MPSYVKKLETFPGAKNKKGNENQNGKNVKYSSYL